MRVSNCLILFLVLSVQFFLSQNAGESTFIQLKNSSGIPGAVFVGENHGIKEYHQLCSDLFKKLTTSDTSKWIYFMEIPKAGNPYYAGYIKTGSPKYLKDIETNIYWEKKHAYLKQHLFSVLKLIRKLNAQSERISLKGIDIIENDQMLFNLLKSILDKKKKFPIQSVDSLMRLKSIGEISKEKYKRIITEIADGKRKIEMIYGGEVYEKILELFKTNHSQIGRDTLLSFRDRYFYQNVSECIGAGTKLFFQIGMAHIRANIPKYGHKNFYQLLTENVLKKEESVRIVLCSLAKNKILLPDIFAVSYGLAKHDLKNKEFEVIKGANSSTENEADRVELIVLFKQVHSLIRSMK